MKLKTYIYKFRTWADDLLRQLALFLLKLSGYNPPPMIIKEEYHPLVLKSQIEIEIDQDLTILSEIDRRMKEKLIKQLEPFVVCRDDTAYGRRVLEYSIVVYQRRDDQ